MYYFVKEGKIHAYPVPGRCGVTRGRENLRDTLPHGYEECVACLGRWPEETGGRKGLKSPEPDEADYHG